MWIEALMTEFIEQIKWHSEHTLEGIYIIFYVHKTQEKILTFYEGPQKYQNMDLRIRKNILW